MPNHYTTIAICSPGHEFDCDDFNERHGDTCLCSVVRPMPELVEETPAVMYPDGTRERERQGKSTDWYEWALAHWGTKWGTYDMKAFSLGGDGGPVAIKFQSAWCPPAILDDIAAWLKRVGGFEKVEFIGFDPYDDSTRMLMGGGNDE